MGKPEGKGPLGRTRRRWENNINIEIQYVGLRGTDWVDLAEDRESLRARVIAVMNLRVKCSKVLQCSVVLVIRCPTLLKDI